MINRRPSIRTLFLDFCDRDCRLSHSILLPRMQTRHLRAKSQQGRETLASLVPKATGLLPQPQTAAISIVI